MGRGGFGKKWSTRKWSTLFKPINGSWIKDYVIEDYFNDYMVESWTWWIRGWRFMDYMFAHSGLINNGREWKIEKLGQKSSVKSQLMKKPKNHMEESHTARVEFTLGCVRPTWLVRGLFSLSFCCYLWMVGGYLFPDQKSTSKKAKFISFLSHSRQEES